MIVVPSFLSSPQARLFHDSGDPQQLYLDALQPMPLTGPDAARWLPVPAQTAYLVGEVRFGPDVEDFDRVRRQPGVPAGARLLPMPWESGPVFLWAREGEAGALLVARGKTSGFGVSNVVLTGTAPPAAMASPLMIAGELVGHARLGAERVRGGGSAAAVRRALAEAAVGERASWSATLADALVAMLERLLADGTLTMEANAELRGLGLLEWAHRIAVAGGAESLALPAAHFGGAVDSSLDLGLDWCAGDTVPLRAVRVLQPGGSMAPVTGIPLDEKPAAH